jgi:hypothetical protein
MDENTADDGEELNTDEFIEWFVQKDRENYTELEELFIYA